MVVLHTWAPDQKFQDYCSVCSPAVSKEGVVQMYSEWTKQCNLKVWNSETKCCFQCSMCSMPLNWIQCLKHFDMTWWRQNHIQNLFCCILSSFLSLLKWGQYANMASAKSDMSVAVQLGYVSDRTDRIDHNISEDLGLRCWRIQVNIDTYTLISGQELLSKPQSLRSLLLDSRCLSLP